MAGVVRHGEEDSEEGLREERGTKTEDLGLSRLRGKGRVIYVSRTSVFGEPQVERALRRRLRTAISYHSRDTR